MTETQRDAQTLQPQALLAAIVANSDDAIVSKTLDGVILSWNAGAERIFGFTADEMVGQHITRLIPPERHNEEPALLELLRRGERIDHFETVRLTKDGRRIDISLTVSPVRDATGIIIGASKIARDITQRKQIEEALRLADQRKDEFLAVLAHELRNPLAPIRNSLHILRLTTRNNPTADRVSEMMERQVNHMVRLVDDLLEVSRISRGKIELRKERIELSAILRNAVETSQPLIEERGHQLSISIPPEPLTMQGDSVRLAQVFANLLNNAAKYTDPGGQIELNVRRNGSEVIVSVRDNGIGIEPEMVHRVFELFTQINLQTPQPQGGLGIGLHLAKSLVELHGGSIEATSDGTNQGSEFIVRLTLDRGPLPEKPLRGNRRRISAKPPRRVLVVDDNRDAAESLGMLLELLGAEVQLVYSGRDALAAVETFHPAVVLMDIGMPDMNGHEVARRIRAQPELDDVTLIALTGWGQDGDRESSKHAGFDYHLIKPADFSALESLLVSLDAHD